MTRFSSRVRSRARWHGTLECSSPVTTTAVGGDEVDEDRCSTRGLSGSVDTDGPKRVPGAWNGLRKGKPDLVFARSR